VTISSVVRGRVIGLSPRGHFAARPALVTCASLVQPGSDSTPHPGAPVGVPDGRRPSAAGRPLAVTYGNVADLPPPLAAVVHAGGAGAPTGAGLVVALPLPQLAGAAGGRAVAGRRAGRARPRGQRALAADGHVLFGAVELPGGDAAELEAATAFAYRELLAGCSRLGYPHLLRTWNVVPAINRVDDGLERYRRFCRGRAEAFEAHCGRFFQPLLPASSGVGGPEGELVVWFLAGRERGVPRENPRQVSAYSYPPSYGPRSPSFARATRCPQRLGSALLLSGTASIVGHQSVHHGDVLLQLDETLANLDQLLGGQPPRILKVYLRHAGDIAAVAAALERWRGGVPTLYLQADICREELLVEIEGLA
jgi:chorismate lyase / 3-hydroxybenzoate synthase